MQSRGVLGRSVGELHQVFHWMRYVFGIRRGCMPELRHGNVIDKRAVQCSVLPFDRFSGRFGEYLSLDVGLGRGPEELIEHDAKEHMAVHPRSWNSFAPACTCTLPLETAR